MNYLKLKLLLIPVVIIAMLTGCCQQQDSRNHPDQKQTIEQQASSFPPESTMVRENGSVPPGLKSALETASVSQDCIACNSQNRFGETLVPYSKASAARLMEKLTPYLKKLEPAQEEELLEMLKDHTKWAMVRSVLIEGNNNNFGAITLKGYTWEDEKGQKHPLTVFRTAFTPNPQAKDSCYRSLLKDGHVRHIINLYDGEMEVADLVAGEKEVATEYGASYVRTGELDYGQWRYLIRDHPEPGPEREQAMRSVARLIQEQILTPSGKPPRGNILVHCGGGMHRTGMIIGILQKAINGLSIEEVAKNYGYHVGFKGENHPGGYEQGNVDFIRDFKEEYLKQ